MNFFKNLFGQEEVNQQFSLANLGNCKTKQQLIERFVGISAEKQHDLATVIGENSWEADLDVGEISFGPELIFPIQILGTFAHSSATWLWAWENEESDLPENIIAQAKLLKKFGEENQIDLFSNAYVETTIEQVHLIGLMASGMFDASAYYLADYGEGALLVTIQSDEVDQLGQNTDHRVLTLFPQLIMEIELDHKAALINYLSLKGFEITEDGNKLTAQKNGNTVNAEFDQLSRLTSLDGNLSKTDSVD